MNWKQIIDYIRDHLQPLMTLNWLHVFKDLIAVILITWTSLVLINLVVGSSTIRSLCDMGVLSRKLDYLINTGSDASYAFSSFDDSQLLYIIDEAVAPGGISTMWSKLVHTSESIPVAPTESYTENSLPTADSDDSDVEAEQSPDPVVISTSTSRSGVLRRELLVSLIREYGIFIDGPYRMQNGNWKLKLYKYDRDSDQVRSILAALRSSELPNRVKVQYPAVEVAFNSTAPLLKRAEMTYEVSLWGQGSDHPLSSTKPSPLFTRASVFRFVSVQPVQVFEEPDEAGESIVELLRSLTGVKKRISAEYPLPLSGVAGPFDQSEEESLARLLSAVIKILLSDGKSELVIDENYTGENVSLADNSSSIETTLTTRLRFLRILNGVNLAGLINFAIFIFVIWGTASVVRAQNDDLQAMFARANSLINILPMLGFFGTLYGMLLAFSSVGVGNSGAKLVSLIGISLDTTLLAVSGAIILSLVVMWKKRS